MMERGYAELFRVRGVALRVHWSAPVAALFFGNLRFEPAVWLAFLTIVVVHELGHAALVKGVGLTVVGIDVTGVGGQCRYRGSVSALERSWIAWGGVGAQLLLLAGTLLLGLLWGAPTTRWGQLIRHSFIEMNLWLIALNLLPIPPLDGALAWGLFGELERSGLNLRSLLLSPLAGWAQRRRRRRSPSTDSGESSQRPPQGGRWRRRPRYRSADPSRPGSAQGEPAASDEPQDARPSAEAQRELAALLDRIGDEAGKTKRRR